MSRVLLKKDGAGVNGLRHDAVKVPGSSCTQHSVLMCGQRDA